MAVNTPSVDLIGSQRTSYTVAPQVAIADVATTTSEIVVSGADPYLLDLNLQTFIRHTFSADLDITLTSPSGTVVTVTTDNGAGNDDVFNGTIWDDSADPAGQVPYTSNNGLVTDRVYANNVVASPLVPEGAFGAFVGENPNGTWTLSITDDLAGDTGTLDSWGLDLATAPATRTSSAQTATEGVPVVIPTGPAVVTSTIVVSGIGHKLSDVDIQTFIQHTFSADLDITLTSPSGTVVTLTTDNGAGNDNVFNGTVFDDNGAVPVTDNVYTNLTVAPSLIPEEALAAFIGEDPNGTWTLTISDDLAGDGGSLDSWSLSFRTLDALTATFTEQGGPDTGANAVSFGTSSPNLASPAGTLASLAFGISAASVAAGDQLRFGATVIDLTTTAATGEVTAGATTFGYAIADVAGVRTVTFTSESGPGGAAASAPVADFEALFDGLAYNNASDAPVAGSTRAFDISVSDGVTVSPADTLVLTLAATNDAPTIAGDGAISTLQGGTVTLTTADLTAVDPDTPDGSLTFNVTAASHGDVVIAGSPVTTFTQADLAAGIVGFRQDGSANTDASFIVTVSDGVALSPPTSVTAVVDLAPTVTGIAYGPNDGTLRAGETVTFSVSASEIIVVTGAPMLVLNDGGTATYVSGSGSATLVFSHTVAAGQSTADLAVTDVALNGGTIRDGSGQDLRPLPAGGIDPADPLAVDTSAPSVTISVIAGDDVVNAAEKPGAFTVSGTAPGAEDGQLVTVTLATTSGVALAPSQTATVTGGAWSLTLPAGTASPLPDGTYQVLADVSDRAGNPAIEAKRTILVDTTADAAPAASLAVNGTADGLVNAAEAGAVAYTIAGLDADATATAIFTDGTHTTSVVAANGSGFIDLSTFNGPVISALAIADTHGNAASVAGTSVVVDTVAPSLSIASVSGATNLIDGHTLSGNVGAADAGALVTIRDGASVVGTVASDGGGHFGFAFIDTADGTGRAYHFTASATDAAGNTGTSAPFDFTLDFTPNQNLFGTLTHDPASPGGQVYALYDGLLARAPDPLGFEFWTAQVSRGESLHDVATSFLASSEFTAANGGGPFTSGTDDAFVRHLYSVALGRGPDAGGEAFWDASLAAGTSRADVALSFALSAENMAQIAPAFSSGVFVPDTTDSAVARLYDGVLGRTPDAGGLAFWEGQAKAGLPIGSITSAFLASQEGMAHHPAGESNDAFVQSVYAGALGRPAEASGLAYWDGLLAGGTSRAIVATTISESPEAQFHLTGQIEAGWHLA